MRYTQPKVTGTYRAVTAIKSAKLGIHTEGGDVNFTNASAYQSEE